MLTRLVPGGRRKHTGVVIYAKSGKAGRRGNAGKEVMLSLNRTRGGQETREKRVLGDAEIKG